MRMPLSRASWMILLIGAESGLTMAMMRLAATMLPNPMLISRVSMAAVLLEVLNLLPQALQLALDRDHALGDLQVVGLAPDGVDLPPQFLDDEVQGAAHGPGGPERRPELAEVAAEAGDLLADVAALGKHRHFGGEPSGVHRHARGELRDPPGQPIPVLLHHLGCPARDLVHAPLQPVDPPVDIGGELRALGLTHRDETVERRAHPLGDGRPGGLQIFLLLLDADDL